MKRVTHRSANSLLTLIPLGCMLIATSLVAAEEKPASGEESKIVIKHVPNIPPGEGATDTIDGTVNGVKVSEYKIVVYAYGDKWYVQPTVADPLTDIDEDGKWEAKTHGGLQYAVLLVKASFKPQATCQTLPKVGGDVVAVAKMKPKK